MLAGTMVASRADRKGALKVDETVANLVGWMVEKSVELTVAYLAVKKAASKVETTAD